MYLYYGLIKMFQLGLGVKNEFAIPKKSLKLDNFGNKKAAQYWGVIFRTSNWCPGRVLMIFPLQTTSGHAYS
jgi:hypothetical protein